MEDLLFFYLNVANYAALVALAVVILLHSYYYLGFFLFYLFGRKIALFY